VGARSGVAQSRGSCGELRGKGQHRTTPPHAPPPRPPPHLQVQVSVRFVGAPSAAWRCAAAGRPLDAAWDALCRGPQAVTASPPSRALRCAAWRGREDPTQT
jgi:hypothetical protein